MSEVQPKDHGLQAAVLGVRQGPLLASLLSVHSMAICSLRFVLPNKFNFLRKQLHDTFNLQAINLILMMIGNKSNLRNIRMRYV